MSQLIISVSGLRGVIGDGLTPEVILKYTSAFVRHVARNSKDPVTIVVSRDGRTSGPMVLDAVCCALQAAGANVVDAGVAATPTIGVLVRQLSAQGGIQISASHNPPEYNGLKLFSPAGQVLTAEEGGKVLKLYESESPQWVRYDRLGTADFCHDPASRHLDLILACVDVERIRDRKYKVVLDANHGSGSLLGRRLMDALGCRVTYLGDEPDGLFSHPPEPTAENLADVVKEIGAAEAEIGFCQDPDADRLAVMDAAGRYLGEELTLALCVEHVLSRTPGPVVTNCSSSRVTEDLARKFGVPFARSAVGEANVVQCMQRINAVLGGEGNGGVIDPRVGYVRDSFIGMALVLDLMAARDKPIGELADALPQYAMHKTRFTLDSQRVPAALDALERHFQGAKSDRLDGLRLDFANAWLLVRASNTEPIVRAIAEAPTMKEAESLCAAAAKVIANL